MHKGVKWVHKECVLAPKQSRAPDYIGTHTEETKINFQEHKLTVLDYFSVGKKTCF